MSTGKSIRGRNTTISVTDRYIDILKNYLLPQATIVDSSMQRNIVELRVSDLIGAKKMIGELRNLNTHIDCRTLEHASNVKLYTFADAAHPTNWDFGRTGLITKLRLWDESKRRKLFYLLYWGSQKQKRVFHRSYGAEIIAIETADDRKKYLKTALDALFLNSNINHELNVDSKALWDTIIMPCERREHWLRQSFQKLHNCIYSKELNKCRELQITIILLMLWLNVILSSLSD